VYPHAAMIGSPGAAVTGLSNRKRVGPNFFHRLDRRARSLTLFTPLSLAVAERLGMPSKSSACFFGVGIDPADAQSRAMDDAKHDRDHHRHHAALSTPADLIAVELMATNSAGAK
jgi:hypothetical protein